jgi:7-cyano-7-deazaguanine synthase in queuosine biosynthesis
MIAPRLFLCSGAELTEGDPLCTGRMIVRLDSIGPHANVNIRLENVAKVLNKHLSPRLVDLLEVAAYVFTADCATNRGQQWTDDGSTESWDRDLSFVIPVRDVQFWQQNDVRDLLREILNFLSDDKYSFVFLPLEQDRTAQNYLDFGDLEDWPFCGVDRVLMFSGGIDSLAGAVQTARAGCKTVLVSHRSAPALDSRQRRLFRELDEKYPAQMVHIPVWINKEKRLGQESTQRTRSFLYSALGTIVAESIRADGVRFFENGIVSINLPVADEALRARASRTTHPRALHLFAQFYSLVANRKLQLDNPFLFRTKAEIVASIAANGAGDLIEYTCSCGYPMFKSKTQWHCGSCSQCIDRRFATLASGCSQYDRVTDYVSDVFTGPRKDGYQKNIAVDYVRHGVELQRMSEGEIFSKFNSELSRAVRFEQKPSEAAQRLIKMHRQHGENVVQVLRDELGRHSGELLCAGLDQSSLLCMAVGGKHLEPSWKSYCTRIVRLLSTGVPVICQSKKPQNEPEFQQICDGLLKAGDADLVREFPFMRWSSNLTKPDWSHEALHVWVEAKYVRQKRDLLQISEAISSDITKYGDAARRVLFVVYDPSHIVMDEKEFSAPIDSRPSMTVAFVR